MRLIQAPRFWRYSTSIILIVLLPLADILWPDLPQTVSFSCVHNFLNLEGNQVSSRTLSCLTPTKTSWYRMQALRPTDWILIMTWFANPPISIFWCRDHIVGSSDKLGSALGPLEIDWTPFMDPCSSSFNSKGPLALRNPVWLALAQVFTMFVTLWLNSFICSCSRWFQLCGRSIPAGVPFIRERTTGSSICWGQTGTFFGHLSLKMPSKLFILATTKSQVCLGKLGINLGLEEDERHETISEELHCSVKVLQK